MISLFLLQNLTTENDDDPELPASAQEKTAPPSPERARLGIVAATAAIALAIILFLVMGRGNGGEGEDGDIRFVKGKQPRNAASSIAASVADINDASVVEDASGLVFEITTAASIPEDFERSSLEFRFDISDAGGSTWILSANINVSPTAALVSQTGDYSATTINGSFPGEVEIAGRKLTVTLDSSDIEAFPQSFEWAVSSNLVAFRDVTGSTRVEDRFPDEGTVGL